MEKFTINVPAYVRYISEWIDFNLSMFPDKCIINKQLPGCGFTEYFLTSNENVIGAVPRKMLGKNKYEQHEEDVYLVKNEMEKDLSTDKDISKDVKDYSKSLTEDEIKKLEDEKKEQNNKVYTRLYNETVEYVNRRKSEGKPCKILVTYDSYRIVYQILKDLGIFHEFFVVVDEFQSILHDSRFKSSTETQFLRYLRQSQRVIFLSATPMLDDYLEMLNDFKYLPYYTLDWEVENPSRVKRPHLEVRTMKSVGTKTKEILEPFLRGEYKSIIRIKNFVPEIIYSDELIFYVNSVNHIISIIKNNNLTSEQVNIICADNDENRKRIQKKLGKKFDIGSIPLKGEKAKPITLCTRTAYLGVDFYSKTATTYIFSDANVDSLAVDISEDLSQILGRLRDEDNPWFNCAFFFYKSTADYNKMTVDDFKRIIEKKQKVTENLLKAYSDSRDNSVRYDLANAYQTLAKTQNYKDNYVGVDEIINDTTGDKILIPHINELVYVNELRAFQIQQIDYADRFTVFSTIHNKLTKDDVIDQEVNNFLNTYRTLPTMYEKLKMLCEGGLSPKALEIVLGQFPDSDEIKNYYNVLGPNRLRALSYNKTFIKKELNVVMFNPLLLQNRIYQDFKVGDKLPLADIKSKLKNIYDEVSYKATPKASDLGNYFEIKESSMRAVVDGKKKVVKAYELLSAKYNSIEANN